MKNNLNEQVSRIKDMMRKVITESFDEMDDSDSKESKITKKVHFNNGGSISVLASSSHYCEPRNDNGPYTKFELGYPSKDTKLPQSLLKYQEQSSITDPYDNIFPYVPVRILMKLADMNGGFVKGTKLPQMWVVIGKDDNGKPIKDVWSGRVS